MAKHKYVIEETSVYVAVTENEAEALTIVQADATKAVRIAHQYIVTEDNGEVSK